MLITKVVISPDCFDVFFSQIICLFGRGGGGEEAVGRENEETLSRIPQ